MAANRFRSLCAEWLRTTESKQTETDAPTVPLVEREKQQGPPLRSRGSIPYRETWVDSQYSHQLRVACPQIVTNTHRKKKKIRAVLLETN